MRDTNTLAHEFQYVTVLPASDIGNCLLDEGLPAILHLHTHYVSPSSTQPPPEFWVHPTTSEYTTPLELRARALTP